jgi:voltage-gated sodium channel
MAYSLENLKKNIERPIFEYFILSIVLLNAIILGLSTDNRLTLKYDNFFNLISEICLWIFIVEAGLKIFTYNWSYFKSSWNIFDFTIVLLSSLQFSNISLSFRLFRIFKLLRTIRIAKTFSALKPLRILTESIIKSIPSIGWAGVMLFIIFYIYSIIVTFSYSETFPEFFGSLSRSYYTLFQIMTFESWSMGIVKPIMELHPNSWVIFISFILISSYVMLNVVMGVVVNAISETTTKINTKEIDSETNLIDEFNILKMQIDKIEKLINNK